MDRENRISDRLLGLGGGLIITFPQSTVDVEEVGGEQLASVRAYFFRVSRAEELFYEPYTQVGSINGGNTVPAGGGFDYLGDTGVGSGDDIFRVDRDDWHVYHFGVGARNPDLRVYYSVDPQANADRAFEWQTNDQDVVPGDDRGYYDGRRVRDRFDPPAITERVSFRNDSSGEFLQWAFEADADLSAGDTELLFTGKAYKLLPITDRQTQDAMLAEAQRDPATHPNPQTEFPVTRHHVGGIQTWSLGTLKPDEWNDTHRRDITLGIGE